MPAIAETLTNQRTSDRLDYVLVSVGSFIESSLLLPSNAEQVPSKSRGNQRPLKFCFQKSAADNALILNVLGIPMVTSATFRKLNALKEKQAKADAAKAESATKSQTHTSHDEVVDAETLATQRLHAGLKKLCDNGIGNVKVSDVMALESLIFTTDTKSDDGGDKRSKTVLDDILGCLQTSIDLCFTAADIAGQVAENDKEYFEQCGGQTRQKLCVNTILNSFGCLCLGEISNQYDLFFWLSVDWIIWTMFFFGSLGSGWF